MSYTLTTHVYPIGTGSVSGGGSHTALTYADITATFNPQTPGYYFDEWAGSRRGRLEFLDQRLLDGNKSVTANFEPSEECNVQPSLCGWAR